MFRILWNSKINSKTAKVIHRSKFFIILKPETIDFLLKQFKKLSCLFSIHL